MELPFSTSKVTVQYFDPHGVYDLISPGLASRLPLRHLHWQSHFGPLRSIDTLHVELVASGAKPGSQTGNPRPPSTTPSVDDGFQVAVVGGRGGPLEGADDPPPGPAAVPAAKERRHQIPGLRRTPYLKVLIVRCDDTDTYKAQTRPEIKEWIKQNTIQPSKKSSVSENHDAFEWMIVHVVIPNSAAYSQPRTSKTSDGSTSDTALKSTSRWGKSSSTLLERLRSDFNTGSSSSKTTVDRIAQIRVGINDVPYQLLPRVTSVSTTPQGVYVETEKDAENAWLDLVDKLKSLILTSFDIRVSQYEDDIREKDMQRHLPGWNFCTFFILKEGLARGLESVGLVEDSLVCYDELSIGLDTIIKEQEAAIGAAGAHGGTLLSYTQDMVKIAKVALSANSSGQTDPGGDVEAVNLQSEEGQRAQFDDIPISSTRKPYRELILANNVSLFDFRCYIFARQISLLLRLANAWFTQEELLRRLKEERDSILHGIAPSETILRPTDDSENLLVLADICRRTLEFLPTISRILREDLLRGIAQSKAETATGKIADSTSEVDILQDTAASQVVDNIVASHAFSVAQQLLCQTLTDSLPITPLAGATRDGHEPKASIPELKTMMHPARTSSLHVRGRDTITGGPGFPSVGPLPPDASAGSKASFAKSGLEELAARRADLYMLSRNILETLGKKRNWSNGWADAPVLDDSDSMELEDVDLDSAASSTGKDMAEEHALLATQLSSAAFLAGTVSSIVAAGFESKDKFYELYEAISDKALRHYTLAGHNHSIRSVLADLAVLKYHLEEYLAAASFFDKTTLLFGEGGWSRLELSMLIMYTRCLKKLQRENKLALQLLRLLTKAAEAERNRLQRQSSLARLQSTHQEEFVDQSVFRGFLDELLKACASTGIRVPLSSFFHTLEIEGVPAYSDQDDSFSVTLRLHSLLADRLPIQSVKAHLVLLTGGNQGPGTWLETKDSHSLSPGKGTVKLYSNTLVPGNYEIDQVIITSGRLSIYHERQSSLPKEIAGTILKRPNILIYQRTSALDVRLSMSKHLQLDKNNSLEVEISSGWNNIKHCEMRIRAATGGLRIITVEAKVLESDYSFSKPIEGGVMCFQGIAAGTVIRVSFPFTIEQDVLDLSVKIDVTYTTDRGTFTFSKAPCVSTALALGVNVQDVFKHSALFSRFTVSTASASPLRLFQSKLISSDVFSSQFGNASENPSIVFPKQPASLLYKITRQPGLKIHKDSKKTMYIRLGYSVIKDEIDDALRCSLAVAFDGKAALFEFSKMVLACVLQHFNAALSPYDLEKITILGEISTSVIGSVDWTKEFPELGCDESGTAIAEQLSSALIQWQRQNVIISLPQPDSGTCSLRTIHIPVDIPTVTIVHTVDIQLQRQRPPQAPTSSDSEGSGDIGSPLDPASTPDMACPTFYVNQLLPAMLHLKWTRIWDTGGADVEAGLGSEDLEFSFEVTAPTDAWLIGGRRKGHFVIPAADLGAGVGLTSTPESEGTIPLTLIPLREGWLPYPGVEIQEVGPADAGTANPQQYRHGQRPCETDYRNLGEVVRIVANRKQVTLSLDASGPGGGPLTLENERFYVAGGMTV